MIDLQQGIVSYATAHPVAAIVSRASALAGAFHRRHLPVVRVTVAGAPSGRTERPRPPDPRPAGWADLVPELNRQRDDHTITKRQWGALTNTGLEAHHHSVTRIFPKLGETGTTREILDLLGMAP